MAWEACSSDIILRTPEMTFGGYANMTLSIGYILSVDTENEEDVKIKIDISFIHIVIKNEQSVTTGDGFWNALGTSWFLGKYPDLLNQDQLDLNNDRDEDGNYLHSFAWPYDDEFKGSKIETLPESWSTCISDFNKIVYDQLPIFALCYPDTLHSFSDINFSYGSDSSNISNDADIVAWGEVFKDTSKFSGTNENEQLKILITESRIDISTSALKNKSTGAVLSYQDESSVDVDNLEVVNSYSDSQALTSIEIYESELDTRGLLRYDPEYFTTDGVYDPYVIKAFTIPIASWAREYIWDTPSSEFDGYARLWRISESEFEIELKYEDFEIPEYPLPDPIGSIDDNTVFRLKKQYDSSGNVVTDENGYLILEWVRCERIGQE